MESCRERTCGWFVLAECVRPTAAAIAYGLDKKGSGERNVLIYVAWLPHDDEAVVRLKRLS